MIVCYINGSPAYPSTTSSIKVTFENAAIKERESRTQELTFPLDITENRKVFGAVNRIETKKSATTFDTCRLYADNLLVIEGKGTITSYSDTEVKIQIKTENATSQYPENFSSKYIDIICDNYFTSEDMARENLLVGNDGFVMEISSGVWSLPVEPSDGLIPIYDETNDRWLNTPGCYTSTKLKYINHYAPQPLLKDVIARVVYALGYKEKGSDSSLYLSPISFFEQLPWKLLRILNTNTSYRYRNALPHWTAEKFFTELSNLFNLKFAFDEKTMTVKVTQGLTISSDKVQYECLDEFSSDYDEDGESLLASSNLSYNLSDSASWGDETIPQETIAQFPIVDVDDLANGYGNVQGDEAKYYLTNIFRTPKFLSFGRKLTDDDGNYNGNIGMTRAYLANLVRQPESEDTFDLNIVPACIAALDMPINSLSGNSESEKTEERYVLTTSESKTMVTNDMSEYVTVEDVVEGTDSDKTAVQERMEIYFVDSLYKWATWNLLVYFNVFMPFTAAGINSDRPSTNTGMSLALCDTETQYTIGKLHSQVTKVENHETFVIKFEADDLPDPRKIFVFRNKRFLCDKIELEITANGISRIKTGYFFEMQ